MAPCEAGLNQVVELGVAVDTEREGENTVRPLVEEDWQRRMRARREEGRSSGRPGGNDWAALLTVRGEEEGGAEEEEGRGGAGGEANILAFCVLSPDPDSFVF